MGVFFSRRPPDVNGQGGGVRQMGVNIFARLFSKLFWESSLKEFGSHVSKRLR